MALEMIVVPIQHWSHNMEGSQFTASMNREMLHDQYPLYKYILVCEFCYSECPTILFLGKLNQSGASVTLPTIVTWMIQNICKPTVEGPAGILCCGCQSDMRLRVDMQLSQIKEDDYEMSLVPYFYPTKHRLLYQ